MTNNFLYYKAINWNVIEDDLDNATWERATSLFWLDTRIPIANDFERWQKLSESEKEETIKCLAILANLATYQSIEASEVIRNSERSQQEIAIFNNIQFSEMVNTKAYNSILNTFINDTETVTKQFEWIDNDHLIEERLLPIDGIYYSNDPLKKRFIALCVEGILVYSQLAKLLELWSDKKFINLGEMVKMVILNESLHCLYLSHKIKLLMSERTEKENREFKEWVKLTIKKFIPLEEKIIRNTYLTQCSKDLALNLVKQEANHVLTSIGLEQSYRVNQKILTRINSLLDQLRNHQLEKTINKRNNVSVVEMSDDDYDF
ncbi:hypothetical protein B279_02400 [Streptococcus equinus ATCC 33317]|uniref:ribonucleotide-diphosphate reductase subunit beta n=1 Tax=Streptococcus equinus TaxID=1335 RepID=UPI000506EFDF|nr:ribonucleotide-diphosphate reductase subunit beta [Streptococcus equinus]KFN86813.1 hypothetical protein B279_02400 [Streptococcus equinus ATCC 33317]SDI86653.1 ribonucleoside-diphosphate reductase beta chain [Streptococcus equinus]SEP85080.1 ribonucleoside-diphosphate reductase beta chain [Streptococcus equinus]